MDLTITLKTFLSKNNNMTNNKILMVFGLVFSLFAGILFAVPSSSTCGGSVLSPDQGVTSGDYGLKLVNVYTSNLVAFQISKGGQLLSLASGYPGETSTYTDGAVTLSMQVCGADNNEKWVDVKFTSTGQTPQQSPQTNQNQGAPGPTCSSPSIDYSASNGYTVKFVTFTGHDGDLDRQPVFQVLKDGNHVTLITVSAGSTETVSNNGDSVSISVCEADASKSVVKGTVKVSVATQQNNNPQETTGGQQPGSPGSNQSGGQQGGAQGRQQNICSTALPTAAMKPGDSLDLGNSIKLVLVNIYSGDYVAFQLRYNGEHKSFVYLKVGESASAKISGGSSEYAIGIKACSGGSSSGSVLVQALNSQNQLQDTSQQNNSSSNGTNGGTNNTQQAAPKDTSTVQSVEIPQLEQAFTLSMKKGWNLFSVPVDSNIKDVESTCAFYPSNIFEYSGSYLNPSALAAGKGYWFRTSNDCSLKVKGVSSSGSEIALNAGWNAIGVPYASSNFKGDCKFVKGPYSYDSTARKWVSASSLQPFKGYFVKVSSACKMELN